MRVTLGSVAAVALLTVALSGCGSGETAGQAQASAEPAGELVTAVGCPTTGPEPNCLTIMANGKAYDLTSTCRGARSPRPAARRSTRITHRAPRHVSGGEKIPH